MDLTVRLNEIHEQLVSGSRTASRDLFIEAQAPIQAFIKSRFYRLSNEQAYDLATDAVLIYLTDPVDFHRILTHRFHLNLTHPETA
ncbi:hypothetical protein [Burkholderia vietnamiensis]|uniref:hypothetical protein n=1 Tax=Burkholderia vietnamiensis TaxID=60552 RepID=UPI001CF576C1|nr:hypothetical protein [Burkholderia vietnamiensis]MCA8184103.1 hypothetical protein [Burkholderia vietnamiensis]